MLEVQRIFSVCTPSQLAKRGLAVLNLTVVAMRTGAGGKRSVSKDHHDSSWSQLGSGVDGRDGFGGIILKQTPPTLYDSLLLLINNKSGRS